MLRLVLLLVALALAACGADGPPVAPGAAGVTVGGDVQMGVSGGL